MPRIRPRRNNRHRSQQRLTTLHNAADTPTSPQPPPPPLRLTAAVACDPNTSREVLDYIAVNMPALRRWIVANPNADAELLEYISQAGGPYVHEALTIALRELERR